MSNSNSISHEGIVIKADSNVVTVQITSKAACAGCHAEGACSLSGKKDKTIDISGSYNVKDGDCVTLIMEKSLGYSALILGYLLPLAIVIAALVVFLALNFQEQYAGMIALLLIVPYYLFLLLFKNKINKKFVFSLKV